MITVGTIKSYKGVNNKSEALLYDVEIDVFKEPGKGGKNAIVTSTCSVNSGTFTPYFVGDKVYVSFMHQNVSDAIIIGKIGMKENLNTIPASRQIIDSLKVAHSTELSDDTTIGELTYFKLKKVVDGKYVSNVSVDPKGLRLDYNDLSTAIVELKYITDINIENGTLVISYNTGETKNLSI